MSSVIDSLERSEMQEGRPAFGPGDRVRVHFEVVEGNRRRTQVFEGIVIKRQGSGVRETFTVRKQSFGVGVERMFPLHSPKIEKLEVAARGDVRRAKLYYLRDRIGKAARVAERRWGIDEELLGAPATEDGEVEAVDSEGATLREVEAEEAPVEAEAEEEEKAEGDETAQEAEGADQAPEAEVDQEQEAEAEEEPAAEAEPQEEVAGEESPEEESGDSDEESD